MAPSTDSQPSAEQLQHRLRLAHQARLLKVRQLDDIRHALIETGVIDEDDPYGHADLADVIRQHHGGGAPSTGPAVEEPDQAEDGEVPQLRQQLADARAEAALDRIRAEATTWCASPHALDRIRGPQTFNLINNIYDPETSEAADRVREEELSRAKRVDIAEAELRTLRGELEAAREDRNRLRAELRRLRERQAHTEAGDTAALNLATSTAGAWRQRAHDLEHALRDVLATFTQRGHPGRVCLRSGWVLESLVQRWRAVLDHQPAQGGVPETVHAYPPDGSGLTPCCRRTPFELPRDDRMTSEPEQVTCNVTAPAQAREAGA